MGKDPAFLFYDGDAARDVSHLNRIERGCYFDIIQAQRKFGRMSVDLIKKILGKDFDACWDSLKICLSYDNHMYFIEWVETSVIKRKEYSESRRNNRLSTKQDNICETYDSHMENENENVNKDIKKKVEKKKKFDFEVVWGKYPKKIDKKEALGYFNMSVKTDEDYSNINKAVNNYYKYIQTNKIEGRFVKTGCNWFKDWESWVDYEDPKYSGGFKNGNKQDTRSNTEKNERARQLDAIGEEVSR